MHHPDETETFGGRRKRPTPDAKLSIDARERPTSPAILLPTDVRTPERGAPSPDIPPPDHARALDLAQRFLSGPTGQASVGREGAEALARRVRADALDLQILAVWRACREGSGTDAITRAQCKTALGIVGYLVSEGQIAVAREWCRRFIEHQAARDSAPATSAMRIYTPDLDGACLVCGQQIAAHDVDMDDGCSTPGARSCQAVAP